MKDEIAFRFTSHYENMIDLGVGKLKKELKKRGYKIKDIETIIHSHFVDCKFSNADHRQHRALKKRGFNGRFLMYCHRTKITYDIEDNKKGGKNGNNISSTRPNIYPRFNFLVSGSNF